MWAQLHDFLYGFGWGEGGEDIESFERGTRRVFIRDIEFFLKEECSHDWRQDLPNDVAEAYYTRIEVARKEYYAKRPPITPITKIAIPKVNRKYPEL